MMLLAVFVLGGTSLGFEICCCEESNDCECVGHEEEADEGRHHCVVTTVREFIPAARAQYKAGEEGASVWVAHCGQTRPVAAPWGSLRGRAAKGVKPPGPALFVLHAALLI